MQCFVVWYRGHFSMAHSKTWHCTWSLYAICELWLNSQHDFIYTNWDNVCISIPASTHDCCYSSIRFEPFLLTFLLVFCWVVFIRSGTEFHTEFVYCIENFGGEWKSLKIHVYITVFENLFPSWASKHASHFQNSHSKWMPKNESFDTVFRLALFIFILFNFSCGFMSLE